MPEQYLTFVMGKEEYGIEILAVQEIRGWETTTALPNSAEHIKGVINLRGIIVPIIDLRQRFGIESLQYTPTTVVIVVNIVVDQRTKVIGIVVDAVSDVIDIASVDVNPTPDFGLDTDIRFITGLTSVDDNMVILLDIHQLLGNEMLPSASALSRIINQLDITCETANEQH
ncbi:purine-binding chemotaxis protein CheW [Shewanella intestini]|uniref:Chemotaxis protein CheW n=2 Tax=Shewanellaceae TaxID=267890 RepID=A0ABS5I316_9GAMM|nr:chemotaxis protein CheW [Shewanella intestini]MBR9728069.1 purine-binding chemotaxis protein CheW [Shewanella intestini]MRG36541.1 chemotaxis protein CheW [Shewanella sp. XMDDZSB0408]